MHATIRDAHHWIGQCNGIAMRSYNFFVRVAESNDLSGLRAGKVSINAFLRKIHNFAVDMNWLPATVIPRRQWPAIHFKEKRAITGVLIAAMEATAAPVRCPLASRAKICVATLTFTSALALLSTVTFSVTAALLDVASGVVRNVPQWAM